MLKSLFIATLLLLTFASSSQAQINPTMPSQRTDSEKDRLYETFLANKKIPVGEKQRLAYEAAREYVQRFSGDGGPHLPEMRRFVAEYEKAMKSYALHEAYKAKKYAKAFEIGRENLKRDSENFYVLATLTQAGYDNAQTGDVSLNEETIGYGKSAIAILDSGSQTKYDPFASLDEAQGFLNFALGWFLRDQSPGEAAASLARAARSGSRYREDPLLYNLLGIAILKGDYAQVAAEYNAKFGNKPPSAEQQAMWEKLAKLGERVIDAYARAVALSTKPEHAEAKTRMMARLTSLYKSFHNNSEEGLSELLATVLSKPLPE